MATVSKNLTDTPKRKNIPLEDFLRAYLTHETYEGVADTLGIKVSSVRQRAYMYGKKGMHIMPKFAGARGARKLDIDRANALIASFTKVKVDDSSQKQSA